MNEDAAALVVGIDKYEDPGIPELNGCLYDARNAVSWLKKIGVPGSRIYVHVNPMPAISGAIEEVKALPATWQSIVDSMEALSQDSGKKLFLFFSGHGLNLPKALGGPILLTQDYGSSLARSRNNIGLDNFIAWCVHWRFKEQFLFYDACRNPTSGPGEIPPLDASELPIAKAMPVEIDASLVAYLSASPNQRAWGGNGKGVLVRHVLDQLNPEALAALDYDDERQGAILYDWATGGQKIDLVGLFDGIASSITEEAQGAGIIQNPTIRLEGLADSLNVGPILDLPRVPTTALTITFAPEEAFSAVQRAQLASTLPPRWLKLPKDYQLTRSITVQAPSEVEFEAFCSVHGDSGWITLDSPQRKKITSSPETLTLNLGRGAPNSDDLSKAFNIRIQNSDGIAQAPLAGEYEKIALDQGLEIASGSDISFAHREIGPDIGFSSASPDGLTRARATAFKWLGAIRGHLRGRDLTVTLFPPGETPGYPKPNLKILLSGTPRQIAGYLAAQPAVRVYPLGEADPRLELSLEAVEEQAGEYVEPGVYRISLDLPWGSWSKLIHVPTEGIVSCLLPPRVGRPPLRNFWMEESLSYGLPHLSFEVGRVGTAIYDIKVLTSQEAPFRVEPFSEIALAEWDLLFSVRRSNLIKSSRVIDLSNAHLAMPTDERDLLMLGLAHCAFEQLDASALSAALSQVRRLRETFDYSLLTNRLLWLQNARMGDEEAERLVSRIALNAHTTVPPVMLASSLTLLQFLFMRSGIKAPLWNIDPNADSALVVRTPGPIEEDFGTRLSAITDPEVEAVAEEVEEPDFAGV